ncbi:unnamed protein product [Cochlearia groenlandica]
MQRVRVSSQRAAVHKLGDTHMTLSPKFKVASSSIQSPLFDRSSDLELSLGGESLIPGLPDDIALNCLLRVPVETHLTCRSVCKRWLYLFGSKETFFGRRKELGFKEPWLFVVGFSRCTGKIVWRAFDLRNRAWHEIPAMPCRDKVCPHGFRPVSAPFESTMFVCGGRVLDSDCPLDLVLKYDMVRNRWTVANKMVTPRSFFASGVMDGLIYAAGGNSADLFELDSAEVLNPFDGKWRPISSMVAHMASYDATVLNEKLYVTEGWLWPFFVLPRGQVYDPRNDRWETMAIGLREGWTGTSIVVYDRLFIVSELERMKMKVYDSVSDSWETVNGPELPGRICRPFTVKCYKNRVYVVGRDFRVAVGSIWRSEMNKFGLRWEVVESPERYGDLTPANSQILFG